MITLLILLDIYDHAYNIIKYSFWVDLYLDHRPCWGTCMIHNIPHEEFLQNLIFLLSRLDFIWRIMINAHFNPFIYKIIKFYGPPSLHPQDSFDELTIAHIM